MKTTPINFLSRAMIVAGFLFAFAINAIAQVPPPPGGGTNSSPVYTPLDSWSFHDSTDWTSDEGFAPLSFTNLSFSSLGDGASLVVNSNVPTWLQFNTVETNGTNEITVNTGSVTFWFAPNWSSSNDVKGGSGPQEAGRLIEIGSYTPDSSFGWWSIYVDSGGNNIFFSTQTNDNSGNAYTISAPIDWTTNYFHFVALTYSPTNVSLYLDGGLATNDPGGLTIWPGTDVLSNGVFFGSDSNGIYQAEGMFNNIYTYNVPLDATTISETFNYNYTWYALNPINSKYMTHFSSAPSQPSSGPIFTNVITGLGYLQWVTNLSSCISDANVWVTNVVVTPVANGKENITFTIAGGSDGYPYDVFANSILTLSSNGVPWAWMGQGYHCNRYTIPDLTAGTCFLILGTPLDSDGDGLTDAYERLVSKSNPNAYSTDGTGMADGWEVLYFGHIGIDPNADPDGDGLSNYQEFQMYSGGYNPVAWDSNTNLVSDGYEDFSGDGLANLLEASINGGNMFTNNVGWKTDTDGDGLPDSYKIMAGISTNTPPSLTLPSYSKNPVP